MNKTWTNRSAWPKTWGLSSALLLTACAGAPTLNTAGGPAAVTSAMPATAQPGPAAVANAAPPGASAPAAASTPTPTRPPTLPGTLPAFAEVTREAKRAAGLLSVWTRDDRIWLEVPAAMLDTPLFLATSLSGGLGERAFFPGLMPRPHIVLLRRVGNTVQLVARNEHARAPAGTPLAQAVSESYSDSLLAAAPLAAAPHTTSKALLVDASLLLGGDIVGYQATLESAYRTAYSLDRANSSIERIRALPNGLHLTVRQHYAVPRLPPAPVAAPGATAAPAPTPPAVPDARSLFLSLNVTLEPLPATPMATRAADPRVGYFVQSYMNFGDDTQEGRRTHLIRRWRLEKQDPTAEISEPKQAIRVVLDRNIPERWREPLRSAALEWNTAFERAGFRNAIRVEQQPANADWTTTEGTRLLAVRWFAQEGPGSTAVGPSQSDPRTGEILRAASIIDENRVRVFRSRAAEGVPRWADQQQAASTPSFAQPWAMPWHACSYGEDAFEDARFGFDLLVERGLLDPQSPQADAYIADALKNVTMHEIGHGLGLRHNFRASTAMTPEQLRDRNHTRVQGLSASVMEYNAQNLPLQGEPVGDYNMLVLGAYDHWAIEYGYRQYANAQAEAQGLQALLQRSEREPALAYSTDEDLGNNDPLVNQRDMGNDPLAFARRQIQLARELWQRTTTRELTAGEDFTIYRRALTRVLGSLGTSLPLATKYVGGVYTARAHAGAAQPLLTPVPAAQQRAALDVVVAELFDSQAFKFDPKIMSRLGVDHHERSGVNRAAGVDFSLPSAVLTLQRGALDTLMADGLAARLADAESKVSDSRQLLSYAQVQERLNDAVWSELAGKPSLRGDIDSLRRNLQREHLRRLVGGLLRPVSAAAADVRSVHRQVALQLQTRLASAVAARRGSSMTRAHLEDSLATLNEALKAALTKQAF